MRQTINPDRIRRIQANTVIGQTQIEDDVRRYIRSLAHLAAYNGFGGVSVDRGQIMSLVLWRRRPAWNSNTDQVYVNVLDEIADTTDISVEPDGTGHTIRWGSGSVMPLLTPDAARAALGEPFWTDPSSGETYRRIPVTNQNHEL